MRKLLFQTAVAAFVLIGIAAVGFAESQSNLLIITVDDMSADSIGAFGCTLPETSPHIDALAKEGLRFELAHVQVGNCMPSRNVMFSGRYPHNNRVEGFYQVKDPDYPVLVDLMKKAGYFTANRGKTAHSTPYQPYAWDLVLDTLPGGKRAHPKDAPSYGVSTERGIEAAKEAGKPFCLVINVSDPHKPFYGQGKRGAAIADPHTPSRVFTAEESPLPGFLPDDPAIRTELAHYYSSVRRADDCVGAVLEALKTSGQADRTVVMFFSDHGMPLPFAKTQLYHHSTRTPWIVRWPGVTKAGASDQQHLISAVDLLPTLLDIAQIEHPTGLDGRSFSPLLKGKPQGGREMVFKEYNENAGGKRNPMRGVQTRKFLYLFNPWSNGKRIMTTATTGTAAFRRMKQLAKNDPAVAARLDVFQHRTPEELYDVENDPDCLHNLIDSDSHQQELTGLQKSLESWMQKTGDPLLEVFRGRNDLTVREAFMAKVEKEAAQRRLKKRRNRNRAN